MSKKLCFLITFVLALGLIGTARADPIDVNNYSFEYDINGVQITEQKWFDNVQGWTLRDTGEMGAGSSPTLIGLPRDLRRPMVMSLPSALPGTVPTAIYSKSIRFSTRI